MKKQKKELGITLVALVVTIIILLILAGVTLSIALSENGIFNRAKEAVEKYKKAKSDEEDIIDELLEQLESISIDDYVGAYVEGYKPDVKQITITSDTSGISKGDIDQNNIEIQDDNQIFKTEEGIRWRIWDYDENTKIIRLISDKTTDTKLTLEGVTGYNNGVWAINEICRQCYGQYNSDEKMKEGIDVANLRRSDIQKVSTYDYTKYKHKIGLWEEFTGDNKENEKLVYYGEGIKYENNVYIPKMWSENDSKWTYEYKKETEQKSRR